jgi:phosphate transport system permease protein
MNGSAEPAIPAPGPVARRKRSQPSARGRGASADRIGDVLLHALCALAALLAVAVIVGISYEVVSNAREAISRFGLGFLVHTSWAPNFNLFGAAPFIYGTAVTSLIALLLAVPLGILIGLYLSTVAHRRVRGVVGPLVETLAAIPSVILGFWGIVVLGPFLRAHLEPALHRTLGFLPIFGVPAATGASVLNAGLIVAIMVVPIIASISRDLFLTVPSELRDGATALGATQWEVVRGVMLPSAASGIVAATFLGLGRALGEAIAITQVIGAGSAIHASLFATGDTLASRIADQYFGATSKLQVSALFYLGAILLAIGLIANLAAQGIVRRVQLNITGAR